LEGSYADRSTLQVPEKTPQYATAALVRHLGGSMVVRAADQLQWDAAAVGHYGSAVVRGGGGATTGEDDRPAPGLHHLTARVYPPPVDYCVAAGGGGGGYCRAACPCDTYAADYVAGRRRDCSTPRVRSVEATPLYGDGAPPPRRRRHPGADADGTADAAAADPARSTAATAAARRPAEAVSATPAIPAGAGAVSGGSYSVPELVTDCSRTASASHGGGGGGGGGDQESSSSRTPLCSTRSSALSNSTAPIPGLCLRPDQTGHGDRVRTCRD